MNTKIIIITSALAILVLTAATAQDSPQKFTLQQCLDFAVNNSYIMQRATLDVKEAEYKTKEVKAGILPQVNGSGGLDDNILLPVMLLPGEIVGQPGTQIPAQIGSQYVVDLTARAEQVVFNPALFVGIKMARNSEELQRLRSRMNREELIYDVSAVFYALRNVESRITELNDQPANTTIVAPVSGIIERDYFEEGTLLAIGSQAADMVNDTQLKMAVNVTEKEMLTLQKG
jgi:outer membrane protein TolC